MATHLASPCLAIPHPTDPDASGLQFGEEGCDGTFAIIWSPLPLAEARLFATLRNSVPPDDLAARIESAALADD